MLMADICVCSLHSDHDTYTYCNPCDSDHCNSSSKTKLITDIQTSSNNQFYNYVVGQPTTTCNQQFKLGKSLIMKNIPAMQLGGEELVLPARKKKNPTSKEKNSFYTCLQQVVEEV